MTNVDQFPSIVWLGFHEEGRLALQGLIKDGCNIQAVITLEPSELAKRSGACDYSKICNSNNLPIHYIRHINDQASIDLLRELAPDVLCVIGWSQILSSEVLSIARDITIGAHASLLPEGRGSAPVNWAIIRGLERSGNTLISLEEGLDSGDILAQEEFIISDADTCKTVYARVASTNLSMLREVLSLIRAGKLRRIPQTDSGAELLPRRRPEDGRINWSWDAKRVYNFVRALTRPYPGAFSFVGGKKVTIWKASWNAGELNFSTGSIFGLSFNNDSTRYEVSVACGNGQLVIHEFEVEGEGVLNQESAAAFFKNVDEFDINESSF